MRIDDFFMQVWAVIGIIGAILAVGISHVVDKIFPRMQPFLKKTLVVVLEFLLFCIGFYETCMVRVPDVVNETYSNATKTLESANLHATVDMEPLEGQTITGQSKSDCRVLKGSTITLYFDDSSSASSLSTVDSVPEYTDIFEELIATTDYTMVKSCTEMGAFIVGNYDSGQVKRIDLFTGEESRENLSMIDGLCPIKLTINGIDPNGKTFYVVYDDWWPSDPVLIDENTARIMITTGRYALFARNTDSINDEQAPTWVGVFDVTVPGNCIVEMQLIS